MKLTYTLSRPITAETLKTCDEGAKAVKNLFRTVGKIEGGWLGWIGGWLMGLGMSRKITAQTVEYTFPLAGDQELKP